MGTGNHIPFKLEVIRNIGPRPWQKRPSSNIPQCGSVSEKLLYGTQGKIHT